MNRTMIKELSRKGLDYTSELILKNCWILKIQWNEETILNCFVCHQKHFRVSEYYQDWDSVPQIDDIKHTRILWFTKLNTDNDLLHPGPFNVLVSPNEQVVQNTITDLSIHGDIMDFMVYQELITTNEYTL